TLRDLPHIGGGERHVSLAARRGAQAAAALIAMLGMGTAASPRGQPAYLDEHRPGEERGSDPPGRKTPSGKNRQKGQNEENQGTDTSNTCTSQGGFNLPNPVCEQKIFIDNNVGSILAGGTDIPVDTTGSGGTGNTGLDWANEYNTMQRFAIKNSRLHIPVVF